jgi:RNA polymerase sigma factor for flagellar operon FliA
VEATISIGQRPTAEQAEGLWRRWVDDGDVRARDRLVLSYAPMVKYLAGRKVRELPAHCELEDLISCGLLALIGAVDRYDPDKGATFEQYAWTRVSGAIMDELRRQDWASRSVRRQSREIERARDAWVSAHGHLPTESELAAELDVPVEELRRRGEEIERADLLSLNAPARGNEEAMSVEVGDTLEAPIGAHDPELATLASERADAVKAAIAGLSPREQEILTLLHVHHLQGAEIGRILGVSESRISQILAAIRRKLKDAIDAYEGVDTRAA